TLEMAPPNRVSGRWRVEGHGPPVRGGQTFRRGAGPLEVVALRGPHVDHLARLFEDARAVRGVRWNAIGIAGGEDALLARDDHHEAALRHHAGLLHRMLMRLEHGLRRESGDR